MKSMTASRLVRAPDADRDAQLDAVFKALADRTRRALLGQLAKAPAKVTELAAPHSMTLAAVSKHLRVLERAGLVERSIDGRVHQCSLNTEPLREIERWVAHYRDFWDSTLAAFARHMEEPDSPQ